MTIIVKGFDYRWQQISSAPLDEVEGMAWGVREDIENGKRGLIPNWCTASSGVFYWEVMDDEQVQYTQLHRRCGCGYSIINGKCLQCGPVA